MMEWKDKGMSSTATMGATEITGKVAIAGIIDGKVRKAIDHRCRVAGDAALGAKARLDQAGVRVILVGHDLHLNQGHRATHAHLVATAKEVVQAIQVTVVPLHKRPVSTSALSPPLSISPKSS